MLEQMPEAPFLALHFFYYILMNFLKMLSVIVLSVLCSLLCQASNLWGRKWLVDFNAGKTQLVLFDQSNNTGATDVKMDRSVFEENYLLKCWV